VKKKKKIKVKLTQDELRRVVNALGVAIVKGMEKERNLELRSELTEMLCESWRRWKV